MTLLDVPPAVGKAPVSPPTRQLVLTLARVEASRLVRNPALWLALLMGGWLAIESDGPAGWVPGARDAAVLQLTMLPAALVVLVAAHLATSRPTRDNLNEVFEPAPHGNSLRLRALLLAVLTPAAVVTGVAGCMLAYAALTDQTGAPDLVELASIGAVTALAGVLGVLLGRVTPHRLAPVAAATTIAVAQFLLSPNATGPSIAELFLPVIVHDPGQLDSSVLIRPAAAHLTYLTGLITLLAACTLLTTRRRQTVLVAAVAGVALVTASGLAQMQPPTSDRVDMLVAKVTDPAHAGDCTNVAAAEVCALPTYHDWRTEWTAIAQSVRGPLIDAGLEPEPLQLVQRASPYVLRDQLARWPSTLTEERTAALRLAQRPNIQRPDIILLRDAWVDVRDNPTDRLAIALTVARRTVGLRDLVSVTVPGWDEPAVAGCVASGQAREALAVWLAVQDDPIAQQALADVRDDQPYPGTPADPVDDGSGVVDVTLGLDVPSNALDGGGSVEWSKPAVAVATDLLDRHDVLARIARDWDHWTNPDTPLHELATAFEIDMPPLAPDLEPLLGGGLDTMFRAEPLAPSTVNSDDEEEPAPVPCQ